MALTLPVGRASEPNVMRPGDSYHKVCEAMRGLELFWHLWFAQFWNLLWAQNQSSLEFITSPTPTSPLKSEPSPVCLEALCSQVLEGTYEVGLRGDLPSLALTGGRLYIEYGTMVITVIGRQEWWTEQDNYDLSGLIFPLLIILNGKQI